MVLKRQNKAQNTPISAKKVKMVLRCFCEDVTADAAAKTAEVNRNTANKYYNEIRQKIFEQALKETPLGEGGFELDESYFGTRRVCGKRGRGRLVKRLFSGC